MLSVLLMVTSLSFPSAMPAQPEAQEASVVPERPEDVIVLDHGKILRGEILEVTPDSLTFRYEHDGTEATVGFDRSELSPSSWYFAFRERARTAREHIELGRYCIDHSMYRLAEIELERALELDPEKKERVERELARAERGAARKLLAVAESALKAGDYRQAQRECAKVLTGYEDAIVRGEARELLDRLEKAEAGGRQEAVATPGAESGARDQGSPREGQTVAPDPRLTELRDEIEPLREKAKKLNRAGLRADSTNRAEQGFRGAIVAYREALEKVEQTLEDVTDDPRLKRKLRQLRDRLIGETIDAYINLGSRELVRGSYASALEYANRALSLDPRSDHARSFRARVETAAAESSIGAVRRRRR